VNRTAATRAAIVIAALVILWRIIAVNAVAYDQNGRPQLPQGARGELLEGLRQNPAEVRLLLALARADAVAGEDARAKAQLAAATAMAPIERQALGAEAEALLREGRVGDAAQRLSRIATLYGGHERIFPVFGRMLAADEASFLRVAASNPRWLGAFLQEQCRQSADPLQLARLLQLRRTATTQPDAVRKILGYLPQEFGFYPNLSAERVLDHFAALKGVSSTGERRELVHALLHQTNLWDARKKNVGGFSGGMKQRLGIAIALAGQPKLLIVDEPTAGLDPNERHRFLNLLSEIGEDVIVILSTHIVEDVRELCRRMAIISGGEVILQGDPSQVLDDVRGHIWRKRIRKSELADIQARFQVISVRLVAGDPVVHVYSETAPGEGFAAVEPLLEDVYMHRVGAVALAEA